jgi:hypothetical protein
MQFQQVIEMVKSTPTDALCAAWSATTADVLDCKNGERPVTIREAGALAELHGMKLLDILAV